MPELVIKFFKGEYEKFSNFFPVKIHYAEREYPSVEHAFVAAKSLDEMFRWKISKLPPDTAGLAKSLGRKIKLRPNWNLMRLAIMRQLVTQKFSQDVFK